MHKKILRLLLIVSSFFLVLSACSTDTADDNSADTSNDPSRPLIITSIFPVYEIVKEIAGDQANVTLMVGANEDAHHYEPSAQTIASVNEADAFIYSSDVMEFWAESMLSVVENEELKVIELADGLDLSLAGDDHQEELEGENAHDDHDHEGLDPHFWLDPELIRTQIPLIVEVLVEIDPDGTEVYEQNATGLSLALEELDTAFHEAFAGAGQRSFVVQHQAFGHLARRYDLKQVSVGGLTTEVEPNPQDLIEIIEFVKAQDVGVIFYQSGAETSVAETIAGETGTEIAVLYDLENQPQDFTAEGNMYIEAMYHNLEQLQKAIK